MAIGKPTRRWKMKQLSILVSSGWLVWRRLGLHGLTLLALVWLAPGLEVAASGTPVTVPFDTPNSYEWTVPDGLTSITVEAWGAQGWDRGR
jgi:hypothetical protein